MILSPQNTNREALMAEVRVEIESEGGCSSAPARVTVYDGNMIVAVVTGKVEMKQGADGEWYHCVELQKMKPGQEKAKMVLHHDDPPCTAKLFHGYCPECRITPDTQSTALYPYCPRCACKLSDLKCPTCNQVFANPSPT